MNPKEYYHLKTATITEADVRLVAACMTDHISYCGVRSINCQHIGQFAKLPDNQDFDCSR